MKKNALLILAIMLMNSCKEEVLSVNDLMEEDGILSMNVPLLKPVSTDLSKISILFDSVQTIFLETSTTESYVGGLIKDIKHNNDTIIIQSDNCIHFFSNDGKFIRKIEKRGRGRGEYLNINRFDLDIKNQNILVFDRNLRKVLRYSLCGDFIDEVVFTDYVYDFAVLPGGDMLFFNPDYYGEKATLKRGLWRTDGKGTYKNHEVVIDNGFRHVSINDHYLVHLNDSVIGFQGIEDQDLFYHLTDSNTKPVYKIRTDIVIPKKLRSTDGKWGNPKKEYVKTGYFESDGLFTFTITNFNRDVRVLYNKRTGIKYHFIKEDLERLQSLEELIPYFVSNYGNCFYSLIYPSQISEYPELQEVLPDLKEDSNPLVVVYRTN